jgi:hypothetical protein
MLPFVETYIEPKHVTRLRFHRQQKSRGGTPDHLLHPGWKPLNYSAFTLAAPWRRPQLSQSEVIWIEEAGERSRIHANSKLSLLRTRCEPAQQALYIVL